MNRLGKHPLPSLFSLLKTIYPQSVKVLEQQKGRGTRKCSYLHTVIRIEVTMEENRELGSRPSATEALDVTKWHCKLLGKISHHSINHGRDVYPYRRKQYKTQFTKILDTPW